MSAPTQGTKDSARLPGVDRRVGVLPAMLLSLGALLTACEGDGTPFSPVPETPDSGCLAPPEPRHYEVFFVVDVSGSMEPFLRDVREELEALAVGFPAEDGSGRGVRVDYYLVAFVNDHKIFGGGRMSSPIALGQAFEDAIAAGRSGNNLNSDVPNIEVQENLLDALAEVSRLSSKTATMLVLIATDAEFPEAPAILHSEIQVQSTYADVYSALSTLKARVHVFARPGIPGLTLGWKDQPALTALTGSGNYDLASLTGLTGAQELVRSRLNQIARDTSCN